MIVAITNRLLLSAKRTLCERMSRGDIQMVGTGLASSLESTSFPGEVGRFLRKRNVYLMFGAGRFKPVFPSPSEPVRAAFANAHNRVKRRSLGYLPYW